MAEVPPQPPRMVIITKVGSDMGAGRKGLGAKYIEQAADASLRRLGIDAIDIYLSHWPIRRPAMKRRLAPISNC